MGLTRFLLRVAAGRPHVLLVEVPGGTRTRLAVEREMRQRGWPAALSPADADLLVVTGALGPRLQPYADRVWRQLPAPRAYLHLLEPGTVSAALDSARTRLAEGADPLGTLGESPDGDDGGRHDGGRHDGHGEMELPGGLPMADRGPDRDGLMLDELHVPLGPLLPDWPAGLVVHTTLQGDVVSAARVEVLRPDGPQEDFWGEPARRAAAGEPVSAGDAARRRIAARLDSLARLLAVAGRPDAVARTRGLRDRILGGAAAATVQPQLRRLVHRLRASRTLRWLTRDLGVLPPATGAAPGPAAALPAGSAGGDVRTRWLAWLADIEALAPDLDNPGRPPAGEQGLSGDPGDVLAVLPELLAGVEFGTVRMIVASLDGELARWGTDARVGDG